MQLTRPAFAPHPCRFGRARVRELASDETTPTWGISSDLKLFATTFVGGFLFVSILIA